MSPTPTKIKWKDFLKAIERIADKNFGRYQIKPKSGSARRIDLFKNAQDNIPCAFFVVHEDKTVWSGDLKKACLELNCSKGEFMEVVNSL